MVLAQKQTYRSMEQIERSKINPWLYSQLIFDKVGKMYNGLKIVYSITSIGKIGQIQAKK